MEYFFFAAVFQSVLSVDVAFMHIYRLVALSACLVGLGRGFVFCGVLCVVLLSKLPPTPVKEENITYSF